MATFQTQCGHGFVSTILLQASVAGFIDTLSRTASKNTVAAAELSGGALGLSFSGNMNSSIVTLAAQQNAALEFRQFGGIPPATVSQDGAGLIAALNALQSSAASVVADGNESTPMEIARAVITRYGPDSVTNWPGAAVPFPVDTTLDALVSRYWMFQALYDEIDNIQANSSQYVFNWGVSTTQLSMTKQDVRDVTLAIRAAAVDCYSTPGLCAHPDTIPGASITAYYTTSARLPLRKNWNSEYANLVGAYNTARSVIDEYGPGATATEVASQQYPLCPLTKVCLPRDPNCYERNRFLHLAYSDRYYSQKIVPAISRLAQASNDFAGSLQRDIADLRIRQISRRHCQVSLSAAACLSDQQINAFVIPVSAHVVETNAIPNTPKSIYDACRDHHATLRFSLD